jgi:hypothetical protein
MRLASLGVFGACAAVLVGACAHGSTISGAGGAGGSGTGGAITGQSGHTGAGTTNAANTGTTGVATVDTSSQTTADSTTAVAATTTAADTTAATTSTGPAPCDMTPSNTCQSPSTLASVSGDNGGIASTQGSGSQWVAVHITENDSSIFGAGLSYTVTLTSPAGMVYDLSVHEGGSGNGQNCNAAPMNGTPAGGSTQSVHHSWGDSLGSDDSRWINIFVNLQSGTDCNAQWNLVIEGAT